MCKGCTRAVPCQWPTAAGLLRAMASRLLSCSWTRVFFRTDGRNGFAGSSFKQRSQMGCGRDGRMIMNIRTFLIGAALAGILNCAAVSAQVLGGVGGGLSGGVNGALSGGMRDMSVVGAGSAAGSLGADLETQTLRRATRDAAQHGVRRVRDTEHTARGRAQTTLGQAGKVTGDAAASASATAAHTVNPQQISSAAELAGSTTSSLNASHVAQAAGSATSSLSADAQEAAAAPSAPAGNSLVGETPAIPQPPSAPALDAAGAGGGSVSTDASASKEGVATRSSLSADANGSASVSARH